MRPQRTIGEPHDRLTRICAAMTETMEVHPERGDAKAIVFLSSEDEQMYGLQIYGYETDLEAMTDLLMHIKAVFEANGKGFQIHTLGGNN